MSCPLCQSKQIHRSRLKGIIESGILAGRSGRQLVAYLGFSTASTSHAAAFQVAVNWAYASSVL
jgi:hypothetical protein